MNKKSTKRTLLTSVLSLVLCMAMLIGTTFAWFTDNVTSSGNIIQSGSLKVAMDWAEGDENPETAAWTDASQGAIFNSTLWEPGYTEAKHIKVTNKGTLALKYQMRILANGVVSELADVIDVYYFSEAKQLGRADVETGEKLGTLSEVLNNTNEKAISKTIAGSLIAGASKTVTIALKMQESAGNEYQNLSIGTDFSIQLLATQYTEELDTFDKMYDENADFASQEVPSAMVSKLTGDELDISFTEGIGGTVSTMTLDAGYQFEPTETLAQAKASEYRWYHVDFVISADQDVEAGSLALAGYYSAFCDGFNNGNWVSIPVTDDVAAGTEVRLLGNMVYVNYMEICEYGNDGKGFQCGIVDLDGTNAGTTVTVKLCMYEVENADDVAEGTPGVSHNTEVAGAKPIVLGTTTYTFDPYHVSNDTELAAAVNAGITGIYLEDGEYKIPTACQGKKLILSGSENAVLKLENQGELGMDYSFDGSTVTFNGVTIDTTSNGGTYPGYARMAATFNNCTINGTFNLSSREKTFNNCTFNVSGDSYNVWTWGVGKVTFNGCEFNCDGKSILVYNQNCDVNVNNCVFNDNGTISGKAAIEACNGDSGANCVTLNIRVTNTSVNGFDTNNSDSTLWGNKNSLDKDHLNVYIDGSEVY